MSIEEIRRRELAEAAFFTLAKHGISGTTISLVCKNAGMSQGMAHHYFKNKTELLEVAMRQAAARFEEHIDDLVKSAEDTPRAKLYAVVAAHFSPNMFTRGFAQAWISFLGEAAFNPRFAKIQRELTRISQKNLTKYLRFLVPQEHVEATAKAITMLGNGIWLRCALDSDDMTSESSIRYAQELVNFLLTAHSGFDDPP